MSRMVSVMPPSRIPGHTTLAALAPSSPGEKGRRTHTSLSSYGSGALNWRKGLPLILWGCPRFGGLGSRFASEADCDPSRRVAIHQASPRFARLWTASFPRPFAAHVARPWARVAAFS